MSQKFCINCGTQLEENAQFCANCGTAVAAAPAEPAVAETPAPVAPVAPVYVGKQKTPGRGFGITSLVLGIIAALFAFGQVAGEDATPIQDLIAGKPVGFEGTETDLFSPFAIGIILCVLGLIFALSAKKRGYKNGISTAGFWLSIIGGVVLVAIVGLLAVNMDKILFIGNYL